MYKLSNQKRVKRSFILGSILFFLVLCASGVHAGNGPGHHIRSMDMDGDGIADTILHAPSQSWVYVYQSSTSNSVKVVVEGASVGDVPVVGDFNGDGLGDVALYDRTEGLFRIKYAPFQSKVDVINFGVKGGLPLSINLNSSGNNCNEATVYDPKTTIFYYKDCDSVTINQYRVPNAQPGDIPVPADYDGDGFTDFATHNTTTLVWNITESKTGNNIWFKCGLKGDIPLPANWTSNGVDEPYVYRPEGALLVRTSKNNVGNICQEAGSVQFGLPGDKVFITSKDGDSSIDLGIFRPSNFGEYVAKRDYIQGTTNQYDLRSIPSGGDTNLGTPNVPDPVSPFGSSRNRTIPGDYNRDGQSDLLYVFVDKSKSRTVVVANYDYRAAEQWIIESVLDSADFIRIADVDGDGRSDPVIIGANNGNLEWHYVKADGGIGTVIFGGANGSNRPMIGDFDGDGKDDFAVTYPTSSNQRKWDFLLDVTGSKTERLGYPFGFNTDSFFTGDIDGDHLDSLVIYRKENGVMQWLHQELPELSNNNNSPVLRTQWGLPNDIPRPPFDFDGDGKDDFVIQRSVNGNWELYARIDKDHGSYAPHTAIVHIRFGGSGPGKTKEDGDKLIIGHFRGTIKRAGTLAIQVRSRDAGKNRIIHNDTWSQQHIEKEPIVANDYTFVVSPDGTVFSNYIPQPPRPPSPPSRPPSSNSVKCDRTEDFIDGSGGALWKPVSESTGKVVFLLSGSYRHVSKHSVKVYSEKKGEKGGSLASVARTSCCNNGGRAHFFLNKRASELARHDPLIVQIRKDGKYECRKVPNAQKRYD